MFSSVGNGMKRFTRTMGTLYRWKALLLVVLLGGLAGSPVAAQDVQVPLDRDSTLYVVDADLRQKLNLFPRVSGFQEARLYRAGDAEYELVIRYEQDGRVLRERRSLTSAEVKDLRTQITEGLATTEQLPPEAQEGRYGLVAATTFHGLIEGGLLAGTFDADGSEAATLTLLGGAMGFFVPLLATQTTPVSEAEADMVFYGGLQGYAHAVQLTGLAAGEDLPGRTTAGLAALGGALEGTIGYRVARRNNWSAGHAEMVSASGIGGNLVGFGIGAVLVGEADDPAEGTSRLVAGTSLLGSVAGAYLGHRMGRTDRYTEGDARIYAQSGLQGANLMGSFLSLQEEGNVRTSALLLTGSAVGGAVLGRHLVQDRDFTGTQGSLIGLGSFAGSLLGLAVTTGQESGSTRAIAQALGSATGFGVTYAVLEGGARRQAAGSSSSFNLNLNVEPTMAHTPEQAGISTGAGNDVVPRVTLTASF